MASVDDIFSSVAQINKAIQIDRIITIYCFEFSSTYRYAGERHDFWEMVYVDTGSLDIVADTMGYRLKQGDLAFHRPDEFHALSSTGENAPSVIVISFSTRSDAMKFFAGHILHIPPEQRGLISDIIIEAKNGYKDPLGAIYLDKNRRENALFGAEQLLYANLEKALITFYRENNEGVECARASDTIKDKVYTELTDSIIQYLGDNLSESLTLDGICAKFFMSKTQLKVLFKKNTGKGVIEYFNNLKMEKAKALIRQGRMKITEISKTLAYCNVHYFSTAFKKRYGMSPMQYFQSVKAREERMRGEESTQSGTATPKK